MADAEDEALLKGTLYGLRLAGNLTEEQGNEMLAAAERRAQRAQAFLDDRQRLLASGAIAKVDVESAAHELEDRERVLGFAKDRVRLLYELASMAETERQAAKIGGSSIAEELSHPF